MLRAKIKGLHAVIVAELCNNYHYGYFSGSIDIKKFTKDYNAQILFRTICLVANWVVRDERTQIHGLKVLVDWTGVTPQHAKAVFSPDNAKKMMNFYQV